MLGRLFKSKSPLGAEVSSPDEPSSPLSESSESTANPVSTSAPVLEGANPSVNANSFEDSYTREILYGQSDLALHPLSFTPQRFRLVVSQDGGNLRSKQVLYDSAADSSISGNVRAKTPPASASAPCSSPLSTRLTGDSESTQYASPSSSSRLPHSATTLRGASPGKNVHMAKFLYNVNDLNDYMFGRGLPSVERHTSTKIHMLPPLNSSAQGSCSAVLLTKLFSISDSTPGPGESDVLDDSDWTPHATFPSRDTVFHVSLPSGKPCVTTPDSPSSNRTTFSLSSRFAVGVIVPLEDSSATVEEIISSNWEIISHYLIVLQKLVCKKLTLALKSSSAFNQSPYINNKRISFPSGVLQLETEFGHQLQKLIKLVHYNVNTPRLVNINAFMSYSLNHVDSKFKTNVINWALEVINWLEFKDGKNFTPLHAQAIPQMHSQNSYLSHSNSSATSWYRINETPGPTNTFLASLLALILPLRDLLSKGPLHIDPFSPSKSKTVTRVVVMTSNSSVAKKLIFILSGLIPDVELLQQLESGSGSSSQTRLCESQEVKSSQVPLPKAFEKSLKVGSPSIDGLQEGGISFTANPITTKPIPIRANSMASDSHSDDSAPVSVSSTKGWDVPHKSMTSLSFQGQKTSLETSNVTVAQKIPSARRVSASNASSMAYLSSSLNSSLSSSASNYSLSRLGSSFMDKWKSSLVGSNKFQPHLISETLDGAITAETLNARPAFSATKSPSPGEELDEPTWEDSLSANSTNSPVKQKYSRTQSLLNLFNELPSNKSGLSSSALGVDRTRTSIYIPPVNVEGRDADEMNSKIIKHKVQKLMLSKLRISSMDNNRLSVEYESPAGDSENGRTPNKGPNSQLPNSDSHSEQLHNKAFLQPNVAFVDEFRPEYTIQSCPVNPRLEAQVSNAMKNDLLFYQNNCGYEKVASKTVFISLRAREIKLIEMTVGNQKRGYFGKGSVPGVSPAGVGDAATSYFSSVAPNSPSASYFSGGDHMHVGQENRNVPVNNSFRTTVKKVYTPNRNSGDKEAISQIEGQLEKLNEVASLINGDSTGASSTKDLYNRMLFNAVRELIT